KARAPRGMHVDDVVAQLGGACPLTGPFHVTGATEGGAIEVEVHGADPWPATGEGWIGVFGGFGALNHERYSLATEVEPEIRVVPYADGVTDLSPPPRARTGPRTRARRAGPP